MPQNNINVEKKKRGKRHIFLFFFIDSLVGGFERKPMWLCEGVTRQRGQSEEEKPSRALCTGKLSINVYLTITQLVWFSF